MPYVTVDRGLFKDTRLHVDDTGGGGRAVLLLHPWPLAGQAWSSQVPALHDAGYRVITYDRRGFGRSDKPLTGYTMDGLAKDLHTLLEALDVHDATLVGCSMGGGEVARYVSSYGTDRLRSVVFASSVTPYLMRTSDNPRGPLNKTDAARSTVEFLKDPEGFLDNEMNNFFSANGKPRVSEAIRTDALAISRQASKEALLATMVAWARTDFREDLKRVSVPALVIHGEGDASVPFEGSAPLTHAALDDSRLCVIAGGPHGCHMSHPDEFNAALLDFLAQ